MSACLTLSLEPCDRDAVLLVLSPQCGQVGHVSSFNAECTAASNCRSSVKLDAGQPRPSQPGQACSLNSLLNAAAPLHSQQHFGRSERPAGVLTVSDCTVNELLPLQLPVSKMCLCRRRSGSQQRCRASHSLPLRLAQSPQWLYHGQPAADTLLGQARWIQLRQAPAPHVPTSGLW